MIDLLRRSLGHKPSLFFYLVHAACITAAILVLIGCGSEQATSTASISTNPGKPQHGGELVIAVQADAKSLDPHLVSDAASYRMIENLYATLLRQTDAYGVFEPDLASSVDVSDDGLTYTIQLREDVTFHSGNPVTAADVRFSIERIQSQGERASHFEAVASIDTPDEHTVILNLSEPSAALMTHLGHPMNAIVEQAVVDEQGGRLNRVTAGSGPFKLVDWRSDQQLVMERFDGYAANGVPYLDRVIYRPMPQEMNRINAMRTGQVDVVLDVSPRVQSVIERDTSLLMASVPGTFWEYVGINTARKPFNDVRVRQAIAWAIDRDQVNELARFNAAHPLEGGHLPPNHWAALDESIYSQVDLDQAKSLLEEAGLADGFSTTIVVGAEFDYQVNAAQVIRQQLRPLGITLDIEVLPSTSFFDVLNRREFDMTVVGWVGLVDPDEWMFDLFHSDGRFNQQQYENATLDALLEQARKTYDETDRQALYQQAQKIIAEEAPVVSLYVNDQTSAWRDRVHGFVVHPTASTLSLRDTWVTD